MRLQLGRAVDRWIELVLVRRQAPRVRIGARIGDLRGIDIANLRTAWFDRDHPRDELRALLGDVEADAAALRVGEQDDGLADRVEQRDEIGRASCRKECRSRWS